MSLQRPPKPFTRGWRPAGSTVFIVLGVLAYLGLRELPPDTSLAQVRAADVLKVCLPPTLPPYVTYADDTATGQEADLVQRAARAVGVPVNWNLQAAWGSSPDPVDWGVRPESCDVLAGGIVVSTETQALMQLLPYRQTRWVLLHAPGTPRRVAVLAPHWGLNPDEAYAWTDPRHLDVQAYDDAALTLAALRSGERDAVLTLDGEAAWLQARWPGSTVAPVPLPAHTLALGMWKNNITLKRALQRALPRP